MAGYCVLEQDKTDWTKIRPDILSGLIWVQAVCKGISKQVKSAQVGKQLSTVHVKETSRHDGKIIDCCLMLNAMTGTLS